MTIEDYPLVGICSTEESARLSQLIRIVNLERVPAYGDSDDEDYSDEGRARGRFLLHYLEKEGSE